MYIRFVRLFSLVFSVLSLFTTVLSSHTQRLLSPERVSFHVLVEPTRTAKLPHKPTCHKLNRHVRDPVAWLSQVRATTVC